MDYDKYMGDIKQKAYAFMETLVSKGITRQALATNDFSACPTPRVYVTIPYGNKHGGKFKSYSTFNKQSLAWALKFWESRN